MGRFGERTVGKFWERGWLGKLDGFGCFVSFRLFGDLESSCGIVRGELRGQAVVSVCGINNDRLHFVVCFWPGKREMKFLRQQY